MKITFTKDHQSVASGNEFYKKGAQADLRRGQGLIDSGVARAGWGKIDIKVEATSDTGIAEAAEAIEAIEDVEERETITIDELTKAELIVMAKKYNISYVGLNKAQLIEAIRGV